MRFWSSYRTLWPAFAVLALIATATAVIRPSGYQTIGAAALTGAAIVAYLRARRESQIAQR